MLCKHEFPPDSCYPNSAVSLKRSKVQCTAGEFVGVGMQPVTENVPWDVRCGRAKASASQQPTNQTLELRTLPVPASRVGPEPHAAFLKCKESTCAACCHWPRQDITPRQDGTAKAWNSHSLQVRAHGADSSCLPAQGVQPHPQCLAHSLAL